MREVGDFVGRERELEQLAEALRRHWLVVIVGPAGVGKTRLARELIKTRDGALFCELASARTTNDVAGTLAQALGVTAVRDASTKIGGVLSRRGCPVVVLDNFEQLYGIADGMLRELHERAPETQFIVTSRITLPMGEELELAPLAMGDALSLLTRRSGWDEDDLSGSDLEALRDVVSAVDGLPLALELAAAQVRLLGAQRLREQVPDMHEAIAWSWELLDERQRDALMRCATHRGAFGGNAGGSGPAFGPQRHLVRHAVTARRRNDRFTHRWYAGTNHPAHDRELGNPPWHVGDGEW